MILFVVLCSHYNLLEEGERFVDVIGFFHSSRCFKLFSPLTTSQINQIQLGVNYLFRCVSSTLALNMNCIDAMRPATIIVHFCACKCLTSLTFEEEIQCFFLVLGVDQLQPTYMHLTLSIILNGNCGSTIRISWLVRQQIKYLLVVDFEITDLNVEIVVLSSSHFLVYLINSARNHSTIFVVRRRSIHCERLTRSCLPVTHNCSIVAISNLLHSFERTIVKDIFLRSIM